MGEEGRSPARIEDEVNIKDNDLPETPNNIAGDSEFLQTMHDIGPTPVIPSDSSFYQRKK